MKILIMCSVFATGLIHAEPESIPTPHVDSAPSNLTEILHRNQPQNTIALKNEIIDLNIISDNYQGNNRVTVSSTMLLFYGIGGVVGPVLPGKVTAIFGNEALFYYLVISTLCAIGLILIFNKIGVRQQQSIR